MSVEPSKPQLSSLFPKKGEKEEPTNEEKTEEGYGTLSLPLFSFLGSRKHPTKAAPHKRMQNTGLTNPLRLVTSKTMFSASSFEELNIAPKLVALLHLPHS